MHACAAAAPAPAAGAAAGAAPHTDRTVLHQLLHVLLASGRHETQWLRAVVLVSVRKSRQRQDLSRGGTMLSAQGAPLDACAAHTLPSTHMVASHCAPYRRCTPLGALQALPSLRRMCMEDSCTCLHRTSAAAAARAARTLHATTHAASEAAHARPVVGSMCCPDSMSGVAPGELLLLEALLLEERDSHRPLPSCARRRRPSASACRRHAVRPSRGRACHRSAPWRERHKGSRRVTPEKGSR